MSQFSVKQEVFPDVEGPSTARLLLKQQPRLSSTVSDVYQSPTTSASDASVDYRKCLANTIKYFEQKLYSDVQSLLAAESVAQKLSILDEIDSKCQLLMKLCDELS